MGGYTGKGKLKVQGWLRLIRGEYPLTHAEFHYEDSGFSLSRTDQLSTALLSDYNHWVIMSIVYSGNNLVSNNFSLLDTGVISWVVVLFPKMLYDWITSEKVYYFITTYPSLVCVWLSPSLLPSLPHGYYVRMSVKFTTAASNHSLSLKTGFPGSLPCATATNPSQHYPQPARCVSVGGHKHTFCHSPWA